MNPKSPHISLITVTYNAAEVLERTILSIINQSFSDYEYIIIDGNSTDGTIELIKKYQSKISKTLIEPDSGLYDAMNKGMQMAEGEYIWFMNAGDQLYDTDTLTQLFQTGSEADIIYSDTLVVSKAGEEIGLLSRLTHNNAPANLTWKRMNKGMVVCHQSFIVRKSIAPPFLRYRYSSDVDWVIKCLKNARTTHHSEHILTRFLNAGLSKQKLKEAMKERFLILSHHFGIVPNLFNHLIMLFRYLLKGRKSKV